MSPKLNPEPWNPELSMAKQPPSPKPPLRDTLITLRLHPNSLTPNWAFWVSVQVRGGQMYRRLRNAAAGEKLWSDTEVPWGQGLRKSLTGPKDSKSKALEAWRVVLADMPNHAAVGASAVRLAGATCREPRACVEQGAACQHPKKTVFVCQEWCLSSHCVSPTPKATCTKSCRPKELPRSGKKPSARMP